MFYNIATAYQYSGRVDKPSCNNLYLPLEIDTEYATLSEFIDSRGNYGHQLINKTITGQVRSIAKDRGKIYEYPGILELPRYTITKYSFIGWDYLKELGYKIYETHLAPGDDLSDLPFLQLDIFAFFAVAELYRIFKGKYLQDIHELVIGSDKKRGITQGRRLRTYTVYKGNHYEWVEMPWVVSINKFEYRIRLCIYDTGAVHGNVSYQKFCTNAGIELVYKETFTSDEKSKMLEMYKHRGIEFDNYAKGDLYNYDALLANARKFKTIYKTIGLEDYFTLPRLTIGSTISKLIESAINNLFDHTENDKTYINKFCKLASADYLKRLGTTGALNAKVDGGRCRNNRPRETFKKGTLCDIDISGCYGEGLRVQTYPIGIPIIFDYKRDSERNEYLTLRQFLSKYSKEFVPGLWQGRVSLKENYQLKNPQDYLASWIPPKDISKMVTDSEYQTTDRWWEVDNIGTIKIFKYDIQNAIITHDFIQWLDNVASKKQRAELLDNLLVVTAMWYPKCERVSSIKNLLKAYKNHKGTNKTQVNHKSQQTEKVVSEKECYAWYGINLGDLIVTKLLIERKKHPKKTPLNELYKLCINTIYGDMVSPFFTVGNVVVGNNITARARALAWCMEKGLNGWQTITDGCTFDLNQVTYPYKKFKINGINSTSTYRDRGNKHLKLESLAKDSKDNINKWSLNSDGSLSVDNGGRSIIIDAKQALFQVSKLALDHLRNQFPKLDVLHQVTKDIYGNDRLGQFEFEVKGFFDTGTFHGTANYCLWFNGSAKPKMRSYSSRKQNIYDLKEDLILIDKSNPAYEFLNSLTSPNKIPRSKVYVKNRIMKVKDYQNNYSKYKSSNIFPGCTVEKAGLLREFSLSQFTFNTYKQYKSWKLEQERLLRQYGQSYEMFFINNDGSLNYQKMIEDIEDSIYKGDKQFIDRKGKRGKGKIEQMNDHPSLKGLDKAKNYLDYYQGIYN